MKTEPGFKSKRNGKSFPLELQRCDQFLLSILFTGSKSCSVWHFRRTFSMEPLHFVASTLAQSSSWSLGALHRRISDFQLPKVTYVKWVQTILSQRFRKQCKNYSKQQADCSSESSSSFLQNLMIPDESSAADSLR